VKRFEREHVSEARRWKWPTDIPGTLHHMDVRLEISKGRYERAAALIVAHKLSQ